MPLTGSASRPWTRRALPWLLTVLLLAFATARTARSFSYGIDARYANDQGQRWQQVRYTLRGVDVTAIPAVIRGDVEGFLRQAYAEDGAPYFPAYHNKRVHPVGDYPPWSYALGWPLHPFEDAAVSRVFYGLLQLVALLILMAWVVRETTSRPPPRKPLFGVWPRPWPALLALLVPASTGAAVTVQTGNYGLIVLAAVVMAVEVQRRDRRILAGLLLGFACIKPQVGGPFLLLGLLPGWRLSVGTALGLLLATSAAAGLWVDAHPAGMLLRAVGHVVPVADTGHSPLNATRPIGVPTRWAVPALGLTVLAVAAWLLWRFRPAGIAVHLALLAVAARVCTYHRVYDDLLILLLLFPLLHCNAGVRRLLHTAATAAILLALLAPKRLLVLPPSLALAHAAWVAGLVLLLRDVRSKPRSISPAQRQLVSGRNTNDP